MQTEPKRRGLAAAIGLLIALAPPLAAEGLRPEARPEARPATLASAVSTQSGDTTAGPLAAPGAAAVDAVPAIAVPADDAAALPSPPAVGPETNLPLPRYVSLKTDEGNARRGPSLSHRVDWVFVREDMPLRITAEYENWRRVVDRDGMGGWVHYSLLSGARTVIVDHDMQPLYSRPDEAAPQTALIESGVIARLGECSADWCWLSAGGFRGWAPKSALWGVGADEIRD